MVGRQEVCSILSKKYEAGSLAGGVGTDELRFITKNLEQNSCKRVYFFFSGTFDSDRSIKY